jgi:hypothetical protein
MAPVQKEADENLKSLRLRRVARAEALPDQKEAGQECALEAAHPARRRERR